MEFQPKQWWASTGEFFRETKGEMKKVSWPQRHEVVGTTGVVIAAVIFFGVYLWLCDMAFYEAINFLFEKFGA
jgi:preprotein translocase subunit SecE